MDDRLLPVRLGRSEVEVTRVGLGTAALGGEYGELEERDGAATVHRALELGIRWIDTAPYYGRTLAEARLGRILEGKRQDTCLATKCARMGPREFDFSAEGVRRQFTGSLERLRTDWIDLYQVHDVEFGDVEQILSQTLPTLDQLRSSGRIRAIGITGLHPHLLEELVRRSSVPVDAVMTYCHHDLMDWSLSLGLADRLRDLGVSVLSASPTHMGVLTNQGPQAWHPAPPEVLEVGRRMGALAAASDLELADIALSAAHHRAGPDAYVVGAKSVEELEATWAAIGSTPDQSLLEKLQALADPVLGWTWHEGRPENEPKTLRPRTS